MCVQICVSKVNLVGLAFLVFIFTERNTSSLLLNPTHELKLNKCGHLCKYVDRCFNSDFYDDNEFMQGICEFMLQEVINLNDEKNVFPTIAKYIHHFHKYELEKHIKRHKRASKSNKVVI